MHRTDLDDMSGLFRLENSVSASSGHLGDVQQFGAVYHAVISPADNTHTVGFNLVAQGFFVFPHGGCDLWTNSRRLDLAHRGAHWRIVHRTVPGVGRRAAGTTKKGSFCRKRHTQPVVSCLWPEVVPGNLVVGSSSSRTWKNMAAYTAGPAGPAGGQAGGNHSPVGGESRRIVLDTMASRTVVVLQRTESTEVENKPS
ncbi:hypothetical protein OGATHE_001171 [Ogataea polymorpha]|uniref:Uncharacterized protein n=1 Tax=Ogataea polymorpha TaxID=460523 RepID=A0A9P8PQX9_9ASCO|nr:hypothetical protein OGATHE_001171 [Ogataea polymorpha]